jgi:SET domain-containing protein
VNLTYFSPKAEKRGSDIDGKGLFAKEAIPKGDIVVIKGGHVMTKAQRDKIGEELGPSEIQVIEDLFFGPTRLDEREGGMMHLNHCCDSNRGVQGQIVFVALRDITIDEELTVDYE